MAYEPNTRMLPPGSGPYSPNGTARPACAPCQGLAPARGTGAGLHVVRRLRALKVDVGGAEVVAEVHELSDGTISIPVRGTLPRGGFVDAIVRLDAETFHRGLALAEAHGVVPRLEDMLQRRFGLGMLVEMSERPLLPR